ncbi:MAG: putative membrane protein YsdA [Verrucomicrobia bacterium]|nr:MAG: putative membrane protein YsdA [Verrucomicrobiota bacterium]
MRAPPNRNPRTGGVDAATFLLLLLLLAAPAMALSRLAPGIDWLLLAGGPLTASFFTWLAYWSDKRRAEAGEWRLPEATLHLGELIGGWPGAFLAQRYYHHKTAKLSYQIVFWMIVLLHEYVALDFLLGWKLARALVALGQAQIA